MSTNVPGQPEYVGATAPGDPGPRRGPQRWGRRAGSLAAAVVAVGAAVGAGTYGVVQLMAGGRAPASAVPATAIGFVSLDLDPSAGQKIEAVRLLREFPALRDQLDITSRDDVRKAVFREVQTNRSCRSLDYARDVEPWIGERVALAAIPSGADRIMPLVALQVSDPDAARTGVRKLATCSGDDELGLAESGDYLLLTERQRDADAMAAAAGSASLAEDHDFTAWTSRVGDPGIVTMYAAPDAAQVVIRSLDRQTQGSTGTPLVREERFTGLRSTVQGFRGAAGVIRFHDGAVEAQFSGTGVSQRIGGSDGDRGADAASLPAGTGAVLSVALQDGWTSSVLDSLRSSMDAGSVGSALRDAERETGLELPEDLETLLGRGVSVSVDSGLDARALRGSSDQSRIPAGIRITGDPQQITAVLDKLRRAAGPSADRVQVASSGDVVAVGTDRAYVDSLVRKGGLGDSESFRRVIPSSGRASGVFFLDFDAGDGWFDRVAALVSGEDVGTVRRNLAPLDALGVSGWQDDDGVQHGLLRLTTD